MIPGVIFPSYADDVVYTAVTGAWGAGFPLQNVADLIRPSMIARASAAGARVIAGVMPSARVIGALALVGHNAPSGTTMRVRLFSGTGYDPTANAGTMIYDSGSVQVWPAGGPVVGYRSIRPVLLDQDLTCRSFRIDLGAHATAWEIGAVEVGGFWEWPGISYGRELGVDTPSDRVRYAGGALGTGSDARGPRTINGSIAYLKDDISTSIGLDYQAWLDRQRPFVWAEDFESPATWPRKCLFARNQEVPSLVGALYRHDRFQFRLIEHLR